jgi:hypothetical protein
MIRPLTCITLVMAACSGLYLYQTKERTQLVDRDIARTLKAADATWQRAGVLRAEYALLNDPSRLADLATQYLPALQTTAPGQFSTWADLDHRLPAVGPPPAPPEPTPTTEPVAAAPDAAKTEPAHAEPPPTEPSHALLAALPQRSPAPVPAPTTVAALPRSVPVAPPRELLPPTRPAAMPTPASLTQVAVIHPEPLTPAAPAVVRVAPASPAPPLVGSALGMARTMRPTPSDSGSGLR